MDNKTFISTLNRALGTETKATARLVEQLSLVIAEAAANSDTIAIPGFGSFVPTTIEDHVETDPETGKRQLIPPMQTVNFEPATRLRKNISRRR